MHVCMCVCNVCLQLFTCRLPYSFIKKHQVILDLWQLPFFPAWAPLWNIRNQQFASDAKHMGLGLQVRIYYFHTKHMGLGLCKIKDHIKTKVPNLELCI